jgi:hypothetical protein
MDSPLEEDGFELVVPDFRETFLLYRFRAANWPITAGLPWPSQAGPGNDIHAGSPCLQKGANARPCQPGALLSVSGFKLHGQSAHNPTSVRCNAAPSESGSPGCNIGFRPRKQQMVSRFDKAHRGREPIVRIHFPPAVSPVRT